MKKIWTYVSTLLISLVCIAMSSPAIAGDRVTTNIRIIHASSAPAHMDPGLNDLGKELQSVFKYTAYRLLSRKSLTLDYRTTGRISLPGGRTLEISPTNFNKGRIKFKINILKKNTPVFGTEILLKNGSSITIGGPEYRNGYLLFNISGTTQ